MTENFIFPDIDRSYWLIKDPAWREDRKKQWEVIEPMLKSSKSGKGKTVIKQYFLTGKMPDWDKMRDYTSHERHLDIFMFIWLHPSWDEAVLRQLRDAYLFSNIVMLGDIDEGFGNFIRWGTGMACQDYTGDCEEELSYGLHTDGHNELLFKVLMGDLEKTNYELEFYDPLQSRSVNYELPKFGFDCLASAAKWLIIKTMYPINEDMLYQYNLALEWLYQCSLEDTKTLKLINTNKASRASLEKALYRIHNFNTEKEGDTCRTRFVHKIRKILDEREFITEFKQMWEDVKADKIEVKDPWKR